MGQRHSPPPLFIGIIKLELGERVKQDARRQPFELSLTGWDHWLAGWLAAWAGRRMVPVGFLLSLLLSVGIGTQEANASHSERTHLSGGRAQGAWEFERKQDSFVVVDVVAAAVVCWRRSNEEAEAGPDEADQRSSGNGDGAGGGRKWMEIVLVVCRARSHTQHNRKISKSCRLYRAAAAAAAAAMALREARRARASGQADASGPKRKLEVGG